MSRAPGLYELDFSCRLYGLISGFDNPLADFRRQVGAKFDPLSPPHRLCLFELLNHWGCRQFAKEEHATASTSLERWAKDWIDRIPPAATQLTDLSTAALDAAADAYADLRDSLASRRRQKSGPVDVTYGPTGAAKTLFAIRPDVFPPWDYAIRVEKFGQDPASFRKYLVEVADQLRQLSTEAGVPVSALPGLVRRPKSSPPKLIDEYNWVVITRKCPPPPEDELQRWAKLARRKTPGIA